MYLAAPPHPHDPRALREYRRGARRPAGGDLESPEGAPHVPRAGREEQHAGPWLAREGREEGRSRGGQPGE